jgi:hypothetical protein
VAPSKVRSMEERAREIAATEVRRIFAAMSAEELAILAFGTGPGESGRTRSEAQLAGEFGRYGLTEALLEAAIGPDGMRDEALLKARMEDLFRWTVWPRAGEIRAARARLEAEGRPIGKPPWETDPETERAHRNAARSPRG